MNKKREFDTENTMIDTLALEIIFVFFQQLIHTNGIG